jgi:hypothetical protein
MKIFLISILLIFLFACQPGWLAPRGRVETMAHNKQDVYELLKNFHDRTFPTDKLIIVYNVSINRRNNSLPLPTLITSPKKTVLKLPEGWTPGTEIWTIGTENKNNYEYYIEVRERSMSSPDQLTQESLAEYRIVGLKIINS